MAPSSEGSERTASADRRRAWIAAIRPQTLPAAAAPVVVGAGLALDRGVFAAVPLLVALVSAELIQIGTNFANDYFDAQKGADTPDREGFTRATASGLLPPRQVLAATGIAFAAAVIGGLYLVAVGGLPILVIGIASLVAGVGYTGGPYPLGYHGLGDVFVFVFFGLIAVTGTYYVQAAATVGTLFPIAPPHGSVPTEVILASVPMGCLTTAILVVNNIRDRESDERAGKRTLAVRFGYTASRVEFVGLVVIAYLVPVFFALDAADPIVLLPLLTLPYAGLVVRTVLTRTDGAALNPALSRTGRLLLGYAVLFAIGVAI